MPATSLNADAITTLLTAAGVEQDTANLGAARLVDDMLHQTVAQSRPVLVETVLSSDKYLNLVMNAHASSTRVGLVFVELRDGIDHVVRVRARVEQGGHDVPPDRILSRREKSHANLWRFAPYADLVLIFDNSEIEKPVLVAACSDRQWTVFHQGRLPDLDGALQACTRAS